MKFRFFPKGTYAIGQVIQVNGQALRVEGYSHTGKNLVAVTLAGAPRFERIQIILTDKKPIESTL